MRALLEASDLPSGAAAVTEAMGGRERDFFIDNLLVRIHFIIEMIWGTGLAPWEFEIFFSR